VTDAAVASAPPVLSDRLRRMLRGPVEVWERLGLRARITGLFAFGALLLSILMGGLSFYTASHFLVSDQINASIKEALAGTPNLQNGLAANLNGPAANEESPLQLLASADAASGASNSVLYWQNQPFVSNTFTVSIDDIPSGLRALVASGTPATQTFALNNQPQVAVGIPLPPIGAAAGARYFAIYDLRDLDHTLHVLALALVLGGLVTTMLGGVVGRLASGRSLRPLTAVSRAAVAIARGDLDTRLRATTEDPDLTGLTQSFNMMVDQLQDRIERDARFTSDVSHELRSPLTTIANTLNVLEAHADELSPRAQRALELLGADLRRFERMVAELLEMSRSDTGSADMSLEFVDASELVRQSVGAGTRMMLNTVPPPIVWIDPLLENAVLSVDKRRFERIMTNLLENAALYGGGATRVAAEPGPDRKGRHTVVIAVEDNGPGVPLAERRRIFERFYRGQAAGRRGASTGTGLGLALVAEHVRLLDGLVGIEDSPGGGARFIVELPVADDEEPE
jgi:two-component system, OmpR family, sensor histidine kinase MtrB